MLLDLNLLGPLASHRGRIETKSADPAPDAMSTPEAPPAPSRRYSPRRTTSDRVRDALVKLAGGSAELVSHEERSWTSITFAGTRHEVALTFKGEAAAACGEDFIEQLPEHEFTIPGQLVADATIREVDHTFGAEEVMVVTAVLLLLEES